MLSNRRPENAEVLKSVLAACLDKMNLTEFYNDIN